MSAVLASGAIVYRPAVTRVSPVNTQTVARSAYRIAAMGVRADRALQAGGRGKVGAVFERSFYVLVNGQWVCLVPKGGGLGPLNAQCAEDSLVAAIKRRLHVGDTVVVENKSLRVGALTFSFGGAMVWRPDPPGSRDRRTLEAGLRHLRDAISSRELPEEGLAQFLLSSAPSTAVTKAAAAPLQDLREVLRSAMAGGKPEAGALLPLIGLGRG